MPPTLEDAIKLALEAHAGQKEKDGSPYILHPLRLMAQMDTEEERMAAVLHDVVEDTELTLDDLRSRGYPERVVELVDLLTHREDESYAKYVKRLRSDATARKIKLADLNDNLNVKRLPKFDEKDAARIQKYFTALEILGER